MSEFIQINMQFIQHYINPSRIYKLHICFHPRTLHFCHPVSCLESVERTQFSRFPLNEPSPRREACKKEHNISEPWEKEHHIQKCRFCRGHVTKVASSLESKMLNTTPLQSNSDVYSPLGFCYLFCWGVISSWELSSCPLGNIPPNGVKGWNYHPKSTWKVGFMYPVPRGIWSLTDISPSPPPHPTRDLQLF